MSDLVAEAAGAILVLFFGGGMLLMMNAALHGGDASAIGNLMANFAAPVILFIIVVTGIITLLQSAS